MKQGYTPGAYPQGKRNPQPVAIFLLHHLNQPASDVLVRLYFRLAADFIACFPDSVVKLVVLGATQALIKSAHRAENLAPVGCVKHRIDIPPFSLSLR